MAKQPSLEDIAATWHLEYEGWHMRTNKAIGAYEIIRYSGDGPISDETVKVMASVPLSEEHRADCKFSVMRDTAAAKAVRALFL